MTLSSYIPNKRRWRAWRPAWRWTLPSAALATMAVLGAGCGASPSTLDPQGPAAARLASLWWFILVLAAFVFVVVMAFLALALVRSARPRAATIHTVAGLSQTRFIVVAGAVVPFIILIVLFVQTLRTMAWFREPPEAPAVTIEMIGWMWWWEVRYPADGIVTANEIHIPAGEYIEIRTTGADVIHAVWPSQLAGKIDSTPGEWNSIWLRADQPGVYRGQCAEFCGLQHTNMDFLIIAQPPADYAAWVASHQQPAPETAPANVLRGQQIFREAQCSLCHTIQGTPYDGVVGPDLTHVASRTTLASALLPNTRATLSAWIVDPHAIKTGVKMPATHLPEVDLDALLDYLETLE